MFKALKNMNGSQLKERPLRVKRAVGKDKLEKKINHVVAKNMSKRGFTAPKNPKKLNQFQQKFKKRGRNAGNRSEGETSNARKFHFKRKMIKK